MLDFVGLFEPADYVKYNTRIKLIPDENGEFFPVEVMHANRCIFGSGNEISELSLKRERTAEFEKWLDLEHGKDGGYKPEYAETPVERSKRRAKKKLNDLIICNHFDFFVTLTLSAEQIDRCDYTTVQKKVNQWLNNNVKRNGLKYVGVVEKHKKGGLHYHFLMNAAGLMLTDSGTVTHPSRKKPIKTATASRLGLSPTECRTVYNVRNWTLGFSTAIKTYGDINAVANYVGKYITKGAEKIGGRWYYSGGDLQRPKYEYSNKKFDEVDDYEWEYDTGFCTVRCRKIG